ncbi:acyl-CoA-binding domain-containing protein 6-like [Mizuhopecten yessoensis]|uniref:Acyl-CoA-binding domain-containing protein 6 n=1 Tax=Mizuhopecten yessoensis TaxID=6573 RepID=A0A210QNY0_MIZYE|nr:acyl-CoA-binding domain-containing protein 6-like [Mizuhopecten yessoensis]XP_021353564.1 acyl-CoA-binding domain-containing protein 6-like [Mizuhopecten yessoensis]OWF50444.1 Acyl-CoA-binding domain-containing protein 6 [Mizuhopecten yessoensis]
MADDVDDDLTELFECACNYIRQSSGKFDSEKLLYFYSRYKQATEGKCNTSKPGIFDFQGKHKWEAWRKLGDMSKKAAMFQYITYLGNIDPEWQEKVNKSDCGDDLGDTASVGSGWVSVSTMSNTDTEIADENKTLFDWCKDGNTLQVQNILSGCDGNEVNITDEAGMTLLHWACDRGLSDMVDVLIKLKADINAQDLELQTPLHFAVCCEQEEVVRQLLNSGANLSLKDSDGLNPVELDTSIEIKELFEKYI